MEVSLTKKTDKREKQQGAPKSRQTSSEPSLYLTVTDSTGLIECWQPVSYIQMLFLVYRALMLSDVYMNYCRAQIKSYNKRTKDIEADYPKIGLLFGYWGNLHSEVVLDPLSSFNQWAKINETKVNGITYEDVTADESCNGLVQVDVSRLAENIADIDKFNKEIAEVVNRNLLLRQQQGTGEKALYKTECMLDIFFLKKFYSLNAPQCVEAGLASKKPCWDWFKNKYQAYQKISSSSKGLTGAVGLLTEQADLLILQTLNNNFPRTSSNK